MCSDTRGATPVCLCTWAASSTFSNGSRATPGWPNTLNRVPELPNAHEGSSMVCSARAASAAVRRSVVTGVLRPAPGGALGAADAQPDESFHSAVAQTIGSLVDLCQPPHGTSSQAHRGPGPTPGVRRSNRGSHPPRGGTVVNPSIRDVALRAGVSVGTVSNVLNRPEQVGEATRDRVLAAIGALGFVRNESARHLRAGRSRTIGLVVLDIANPFFTDVARGVEEVAGAAGLAVILCNSDDRADKEIAHLDVLTEQRVQGVLITPTAELAPHVEALRSRGTPVVLLDRRAPGPQQCAVAVDDVLGGRLAAEHLLERGHRRIAFIGGSAGLPQVQERHDGVVAAVLDGTGSEEALTVLSPPALTAAGGREAAAQIIGLPAGRRPTAAVCANDLMALGVLQEMVRHGVRVPEDFAIVGYDDIDFAAAAAVPLTSVRKPRVELGLRAAELLLDEATRGTEHVHEQPVFEPTLVVRESSMVRRHRRTVAS